MTKTKAIALFVALAGTAFYFYNIFSGTDNWEAHNKAGLEAFGKGFYSAAEKEFVEALKKAERFPLDDPRLHWNLNQLAGIYQVQSKFTEAEPLIRRVLEIDKRKLGPEHPNVAASFNNLAGNYRLRGKYEEAETEIKRALAILEKTFGPEDPGVDNVKAHYAYILRAMGRNAEAEKLEAGFKTKTEKQTAEN